MATKRKRKIRYDRLALVIIICATIIATIVLGVYHFINYVKEQQALNREATQVNVIVDGIPYTMNANEFIDFRKYNIVPDRPTIEEFTTMMEEVVKEPELISLGEFRLTGYCNCEKCCGVWSGGPCYNGEMPEAEWTIAVDPDVIPINSLVSINGHVYKAQDTGSAINENRIDIYCNTHQECFSDFCNGYAEVYLVNE